MSSVREVQPDLLDTSEAGPMAIRGTAVRGIGYVFGISASVVSASLLLRHLGVRDFGSYVTVLALVSTVGGITDAGLSSVGVREYAVAAGAERDALMRNLVGLRIALTAAGVLGAIGFAAVAGYGSELVLATALAGLGLLLGIVGAAYLVPLTARLQLTRVTLVDLLRQLATVAAIITLVAAGAGLVSFLAVSIPVSVLVLAVTVPMVRGLMPLAPAFHLGRWRRLARSVLPFSVAVAIGTIYFRVTIILTSLVASKLETGYYATAYRVLEVLIAIPPILVGSMLPVLARAARDDPARLRYAMGRLFDVGVMAGAAMALGVALGAQFAVDLLSGGRSDPSVPVLQVEALALLLNFVSIGWQYGLLSLHRHRDLLWTAVGGLVVAGGLTLVLVPPLGALGAGIAVTAGELMAAVSVYACLRRAQRRVDIGGSMVLRTAVAAGAGGLLALVPGLPSVAAAAIGVAVFVGVLAALRGIPPELFAALRLRRTPAG